MAIYFWYSAATSVTGPKLAEKLSEKLGVEVSKTREKPNTRRGDVVICYGAKTSRNVSFPAGVKVINHPNKIRVNRHKGKALTKLYNRMEQNVMPFVDLEEITDRAIDNFLEAYGPVVMCRANYHQAGRGLYLCSTRRDIKRARSNGAGYAQAIAGIDTEYRIHITGEKVIAVSKKVLHRDPKAHWIDKYYERFADRVGEEANEEQAKKLLNMVAKDISFPDLLVRSNTRGWVFKRMDVNEVPDNIKEVAVNAVKALGLEFGAVDCGITNDNKCIVIEVNTGPALEGNMVDKFLNSLISEYDLDDRAERRQPARAEAQAAAEPILEVAEPAREAGNNDDLMDVVNRLMDQNRELMAALERLGGRR